MSTHRQIKLQPKYRPSANGSKTVPWLTLSGVWLEELGFKPGDTVTVTTREKLLIIAPAEELTPAAHTYETVLQEVKHSLKKLARHKAPYP